LLTGRKRKKIEILHLREGPPLAIPRAEDKGLQGGSPQKGACLASLAKGTAKILAMAKADEKNRLGPYLCRKKQPTEPSAAKKETLEPCPKRGSASALAAGKKARLAGEESGVAGERIVFSLFGKAFDPKKKKKKKKKKPTKKKKSRARPRREKEKIFWILGKRKERRRA